MNWIHRGAGRGAMCALALGWLLAGPLAGQEQLAAPPVLEAVPLPAEGTPIVYVNTQAILPVAPGADSRPVRRFSGFPTSSRASWTRSPRRLIL